MKPEIHNLIQTAYNNVSDVTIVGHYHKAFIYFGTEQGYVELLADQCENKGDVARKYIVEYDEAVKALGLLKENDADDDLMQAAEQRVNDICDKGVQLAIEAQDFNIFDGDTQRVFSIKNCIHDQDIYTDPDQVEELLEEALEEGFDTIDIPVFAKAPINGGYKTLHIENVTVSVSERFIK